MTQPPWCLPPYRHPCSPQCRDTESWHFSKCSGLTPIVRGHRTESGQEWSSSHVSTREWGSGARVHPPTDYYEGQEAEDFLKLIKTPRYALDTEFKSSSTYFPKLSLVQIATPTATAIFDPLRQDPQLLAPLLNSDSTMVAHAALNDVDILRHYGLPTPSSVLDTQIAAQLLGHSILSLADLAALLLGVTLDKTHQRRDWTLRPLPPAALEYAAKDVAYLLELADILEDKLCSSGKIPWWHEDSTHALAPVTEDDVVIVGPRSSKALSQRKAAIIRWRERTAQRRDIPRRWVVDDATVLAWARELPLTLPMLSGPEENDLRTAIANAPKLPTRALRRRTKDQKASLVRLRAARDVLAADLRVDAPLLATTKDLERLVDGTWSRLDQGWRREHALGPLRAVLGALPASLP